MESQPQNPEFRINLENFNPCNSGRQTRRIYSLNFIGNAVFSFNKFQIIPQD